MENRKFTIEINATREKVWDTLWGDATYLEWTAVFSEGSKPDTEWKEGSKILFLDKNNQGMVSTIAANRPPEFMSFKHLGVVKDGVEDLESEFSKQFSGAFEDYILKAVEGKTILTVDIDIPKTYLDYFVETWPKALEKVKELAERKN
jgi:hypothetical protein